MACGVPSADEAPEIIGNDGWTQIKCDECFEKVDAAVFLGDSPSTDYRPPRTCHKCLKAALAMIFAEPLQVRSSSQVT